MKTIAHTLLVILFFLASCQSRTPEGFTVSSWRLIGEKRLPQNFSFSGIVVGGFSGIDYDEKTDSYLVICDDMAEYGPTRFYRIKLFYDENSLDSIEIISQTTLLRPDGGNFLARNSSTGELADPESIRIEASTQTIYWTSEGDSYSLSQPFVRQADLFGKHLLEVPLPSMFSLTKEQKGVRANAVFESLSLATDAKHLWVVTEAPLLEDGEKAGYLPTRSPVRLSLLDKKTGNLVAQYGYLLEQVAKKPATDSTFCVNGVVEILAVNDYQLLVLERSYTAGYADGGNAVKLFLADTRSATNVATIPSLAQENFVPVTKTLLLNFDTLPLQSLDNIEGFCWGKTLSNGHRTLVFVSDNNFNDTQVTQFIVLELTP